MNSLGKSDFIVVTGPTASGKSQLALELARLIEGEIVNVDAFQVYQGLETLTAAPTLAEKQAVPHHLFSFLPVSEPWNASSHAKLVHEKIAEISAKEKTPILVGGSGLYLKFVTHGKPTSPESRPELRAELEAWPLEKRVAELQRLDPEGAAATNLQNPRYVTRNLEIVITTGMPLAHSRQNWIPQNLPKGFCLDWEPEMLRQRIFERTKKILNEGGIEEVKALAGLSETASKTLGIREINDLLKNAISLEECENFIATKTCQYAKRQRTWFRREFWLEFIRLSESNHASDLADSLTKDYFSADGPRSLQAKP